MPDEKFAAPVSYDALLAENVTLRARIAELEGRAPPSTTAPTPKKFKPHELDPKAEDSFRRPAYSRRTT